MECRRDTLCRGCLAYKPAGADRRGPTTTRGSPQIKAFGEAKHRSDPPSARRELDRSLLPRRMTHRGQRDGSGHDGGGSVFAPEPHPGRALRVVGLELDDEWVRRRRKLVVRRCEDRAAARPDELRVDGRIGNREDAAAAGSLWLGALVRLTGDRFGVVMAQDHGRTGLTHVQPQERRERSDLPWPPGPRPHCWRGSGR